MLLPIGLHDDNDPLALAGGITLGAGLGLIALASWFLDLDSPTFRPGSAAHFAMPGAAP